MSKIYVFLMCALAWCSVASARASVRGTPGVANTGAFEALQQFRRVSGTVIEKDGTGLPGVSVLVEGTTEGTMTDADGKFTINVPSEESILVFSFIGFVTQKIPVGTQTTVDVSLAPDVTSLGEVVVVGYTTQAKATLTGAVSQIENKDIVRTKNENVLNALTGKLPGVRVIQKSAAPGAYDTQIDIRGMSQTGDPLFVVDGIVRDKDFFARMTSEEIDNVSILKDGAAAIYGLGAANGVVLVTTKKGTSQADGKVNVTLNTSYSTQRFLYVPKSVGAIDYMTLVNEKNAQDFYKNYQVKQNPIFTDDDFAPYLDGTKKSYNWFDKVFRKSTPQQETNLSVSGGGEKLRYYFNLGYSKQMGSYRSNDYYSSRWNMRMNIDAQITKRLKAQIGLGSIMVNTHQPDGTGWTTYKLTWLTRPDASFYANDNPEYPNGNSLYLNEGANMFIQTNADYVGSDVTNDRKFNGTMTLQYDIPGVKGLAAKAVYDYSPNIIDYSFYKRAYTLYQYTGADYTPISRNKPSGISRTVGLSYSTNMQLGLQFNRTLFSNHNISSFLIYQERYNTWDSFTAYRKLLINSQYLYAGETDGQLATEGGLGDIVTHSFLGQLNYDYKSKYLLDVRFRYDGSSSFPKDRRFGFFPSISAGWRLSEEEFVKNLVPLASTLKLRGSYGVMGDNSGVATYPPTQGYGLDGNNYGWYYGGVLTGGVSAQALVNPNLTWYTAKAYDAGLDFGLYNDHITGSFDVYKRDLLGLLATSSAVIPGTVGATLPQENLNNSRNFGYELAVRYNSNYRDVRYYVGGQFSATRSMRTKWLETPAGNSYDRWRNRTSGRYDNIWWGDESQTQYTSNQQIQNSQIPTSQGTLPGDWQLNDWNGDGVVDQNDDHPIGTQGRAVFNYGVSVGGSWRGLDLAIDCQGAYGIYVKYSEVLTEALPFGGQNTLSYFMDRWHPVDPNADYYDPNTKWVSGYYPATGRDGRNTGTNGVQNASYMRVKTAQLGYTLPKKWISKVGMENVRLYVSGYNLLTFTKLKNVDPERPTSGGTGAASVEFYNYPVNKSYTVGATVKF